MRKFKDLSGQRFGRLTAIEYFRDIEKKVTKWKCLCDCGNITFSHQSSLCSGRSKSCGCLQKETVREQMTKHNMHNTKEYRAWHSMMSRCYRPSYRYYHLYGELGIGVADELNTFEKFYTEVGPAPDQTISWSIDRIDNTKGYEIGNIRWADIRQQMRNRGSFRNNTSGVIGVRWQLDKRRGTTTCIAHWQEYYNEKSTHQSKSFSVSKYGLLPAFAMACAYREKMIARLNELGYGYSESHGKEKGVVKL